MFKCEVVPVELRPHENADRLSVARVYGFDVVVRTEDWLGKDRGIYVPVDALVPVARPEFSFLAAESKDGESYRVKAKRLRGVFSMGLLLPLPAVVDVDGMRHLTEVGSDWTAELGVVKYEEPEVRRRPGAFQVQGTHEPEETPPGTCKYTDIEHFRRHDRAFREGELVAVTEKIHGANARYVWLPEYPGAAFGRLHVGSRNQFKRADPTSAWWRAVTVPMLRLAEAISPMMLCGEVYGQGVQDLGYGTAEPRFVAFDVYCPETERYLDYHELRQWCLAYRVPMAPLLYVGPYARGIEMAFTEDDSVLAGSGQMSEGVVIRPLYERRDPRLGRVILKWPAERYLLRQEKSA